MSDESYRRWCKACTIVSGVVALPLAFFLIFIVFNRDPAIVYGDNSIEPHEVSAGQEVELCFAGTTWMRLCPSTLVQIVQIDGRQFDLPAHRIEPPRHTGDLPAKCRAVRMPLFGDGVRGPAMFSGFARSRCWPTDDLWPLETTLPTAQFVVK